MPPSNCNFLLDFLILSVTSNHDREDANNKQSRDPKLEGCAFANFGYSSGTKGNSLTHGRVIALPKNNECGWTVGMSFFLKFQMIQSRSKETHRIHVSVPTSFKKLIPKRSEEKLKTAARDS